MSYQQSMPQPGFQQNMPSPGYPQTPSPGYPHTPEKGYPQQTASPGYQQPQANPGMSVTNGNRNAKNLPVGADGRDWSNGFCGCCSEPGTCIVAWCCPCITYGRVKHRYEHLNSRGSPDPEHGGCCTGDCMIHGCITMLGFGWVMQMMLRGNIRSRYNISGGGCGDCCAALCCTPCQLTQESRELELEEQTYGKY